MHDAKRFVEGEAVDTELAVPEALTDLVEVRMSTSGHSDSKGRNREIDGNSN